MGKQFSYVGFNGFIQKVVLRLGYGAHVYDVNGLNKLITVTPNVVYPIKQVKELVGEDK